MRIDGLRPDDPSGQLKVVGWGSLAQEVQNKLQVGQRLVLEGRLRMNTVPRPDGVKEKRAEMILSRLHSLIPSPGPEAPAGQAPQATPRPAAPTPKSGAGPTATPAAAAPAAAAPAPIWDPSPLVPREGPEDDDIPF